MCIFLLSPPPTLGKRTCWTISTAAAHLPFEYSRKHLLRAEPGSSLAAVAYCQWMLVGYIQLCACLKAPLWQCVNVNSGWSASWLMFGIHSPFRPQSDSAWCWPIVGGLIATFLFIEEFQGTFCNFMKADWCVCGSRRTGACEMLWIWGCWHLV